MECCVLTNKYAYLLSVNTQIELNDTIDMFTNDVRIHKHGYRTKKRVTYTWGSI
jgi:hypothetical protein